MNVRQAMFDLKEKLEGDLELERLEELNEDKEFLIDGLTQFLEYDYRMAKIMKSTLVIYLMIMFL